MTRLLVALWLLVLSSDALAIEAKLAVLEFANSSTERDYDPLGKGLQSMIMVDLAAIDGFSVIERTRLSEVDLGVGEAGEVSVAVAAKAAKALGASHAVLGRFDLEGGVMRLTARIVDAASGREVASPHAEGERDAFFELEKTVVKSLIASIGVTMAPKERAEVSRIHTADFLAFQDFSRGLSLFDQKRYDEALEALRSASARDERFELAKLTLADYEELIAKLRTKADAIETVKAERERLAKLSAAGEEVEVARRLLEVASLGGKANQRRRLTALYTLSVGYANLGTNRGKLAKLRAFEDRFAMKRAAEALAQRYWEEAITVWPAAPIAISDKWFAGMPALATFDADLDAAVNKLFELGADHPVNRRNYYTSDLRYPRETARLRHLDRKEEVELLDLFWDKAVTLDPGDYWLEHQGEERVKAYRSVLRLDESTRLLQAAADKSDNEYRLRGYADEIAYNRDLTGLISGAAVPTRVREFALLALAEGWSRGPIVKQGTEQFSGKGPLTPKALLMLSRFRDWPGNDGYLLVGDVPVWAQQAAFHLRSGPRTDALRAGSIRYNRDPDNGDVDPLLIAGGQPTASSVTRFRLRWDPADDYWPPRRNATDETTMADRNLASGRPTVGFLFGARDIDTAKQEDPATEKMVIARPMRAWEVRIGPGEIALVALTETSRGSFDRKDGFEETVLQSKKTSVPRDARVEVRIGDGKATIDVAGTRVSWKVPGLEAGFHGFRIRGEGYVEIGELALKAP